MVTSLFPCPKCRRQHALYFFNKKNGRVLAVVCDMTGAPVVVPIPKSLTDCMADSDLVGLPEISTAQYRKREQNKGNLQFVLMNTNPGEQVERNVELPRAAACDDGQKAKEIQKLIAECVEKQAEFTKRIESLAKERIALENYERELRKKLREVWTEPLGF